MEFSLHQAVMRFGETTIGDKVKILDGVWIYGYQIT